MADLRFLQHELIKNGILESLVESYSEKHVVALRELINSFNLKGMDYNVFLLEKNGVNLIIINWNGDFDIGDCLYIIIKGTSYYTVERTFNPKIDTLKALSVSMKYRNNRKKKMKKLRSIGALDGEHYMLRLLTKTANINLGNIEPDLSVILSKIS